jgi:exopolyphosphatase/guanosine-5'-triphosphate,3'-diphosphate pyrophosphatase
MPGFTDRERMLVATLCRFHRKSMPSARHDLFQSLSAEDKRTVNYLTPLLRIADGLDSGQEQRIERLECQIKSGGVVLILEGRDVDLEVWAAERAADSFRVVYDRPLQLSIRR